MVNDRCADADIAIIALTFTVNGEAVRIEAAPTGRLTSVLRDQLGMSGTKVGCDAGDCGACTILLDGEMTCACMIAAAQVEGRSITTVEGLRDDPLGARLKDAFLAHGAAQCGICTPGMLMSAKALLDETASPAEDQVRDALGGVLCRCTGYQKIVEAVLAAGRGGDVPPPSSCEPPPGGAAIGQPLPRLDGQAKVDGADRFSADGWPAGMRLCRVIRSPHHHAHFTLGDLTAFAAAHPGVHTVLTAKDIPGRNCFGVIPAFADQPVFAETTARFKGEAVAAVIGEVDVIAGLDLSSLPILWDPLPAMLTTEDAAAPEAVRLHDDRPGNLLTTGRVITGDLEAGFAEADIVLERHLTTSWVEHAYIEPEAGWARRFGDRLEIQAGTQAPHLDRESLAAIMDLASDRIRVVPTSAGGGFGAKLDLSLQPFIALAAWRLNDGRPVGCVYSRPESMMSTTKRHPAAITMRAGVKKSGEITALQLDGAFNTGAYASWGPTVAGRVPVHGSGPYIMRNYRAEARAYHSNGPVAGAFRGFGVPQAALAQETLFDQLADAIGMDRLDFRLMNALENGIPTVTGQVFDDGVGIKACLHALKPHWREARQRAKTRNEASSRMANEDHRMIMAARGVGLACCWYGCGNTSLPNPSTIKLGLHRDGRVVLFQGAVDIGQGASTVITQIAADALGLPVGCFYLEDADTDQTPDAGKTSASRQTFVSGNAAKLAGAALRRALLRHANASERAVFALMDDQLSVTDGELVRALDLADLPADRSGFVALVEETYSPPTTALDENGQGAPYAVFGYGAHLVELVVDLGLGTVKLERLIAAHDVGRAINPLLIEGQVEGGVAQGIGLALMENYVPGRTENLHDYLIPTVGDMPRIETIIIEEPSSAGPFGAKGLGEHVLIPTAPAILNAIRDATGVQLDQVPATPDRVLAALKARGGGGVTGWTGEEA